jgi:hypothetical protein
LKNDVSSEDSNKISKDELQRLYYYPAQDEEAQTYARNSEMMEISASNYYPPNSENFQDFSGAVTTLPTVEEFEFEKIMPSDIKKVNVTEPKVEMPVETKPNTTQNSNPNLDAAGNPKYSKLLFSSHSATVTSNGPSGPFKAIICHDCDNSEGRNVGHSVSFSAIKSWNVGSSSTSNKAPSQLEQVSNHTLTKETYPENGEAERVQAPDKWIENQNDREENQQIEMNDKVELYKVENVPSDTEKPIIPTNTWNYSHLPINNDNPITQKKPIFNDLLKVPYDVLNAPLKETPASEPVKGTQIHINHQQKFNDTITSNYQHFQQFIHKNLKPSMMQSSQHYQSTPMPEQNYEVDESVSLMTNGRAHGVQTTTMRINSHVDDKNSRLPSNVPQDQEQDAKFGYVVEGRNFRKYRVEEKTADGFIVG